MTEAQAREEICRVGRSLFERGYAHATAGNISVRLDDGGFLITPTDACLGFLDPARLARLDAQGRQVSGDRASKTIALHTRIYAAARAFDAQTACVIHTHGELNHPYLFSVIDEVAAQCGWQGWVGCEYLPARGAVPGGTTAGLGWARGLL